MYVKLYAKMVKNKHFPNMTFTRGKYNYFYLIFKIIALT